MQHGNGGTAQVQLIFTAEGARRINDATGKLRGKRLTIIVHGRLVAAPAVRDHISGGTALTSENFSEAEASDWQLG